MRNLFSPQNTRHEVRKFLFGFKANCLPLMFVGARSVKQLLVALVLSLTFVCPRLLLSEEPVRKPRMDDTIRANIYADNAFRLYVNGELVAVDSIQFVPHNVVSVDILPAYPMTIAVMGIDNADSLTGMEYANTNIGDGGFILKFGDGTATSGKWKVKVVSSGPTDGDKSNPRVVSSPLPDDWHTVDFDDGEWGNAKEFSEKEVGPKEPFFEHDFEGAKFIWSDDLQLDNIVLFRTVVPSPPDGRERPDFRGLTDVVPLQGGGRSRARGGREKQKIKSKK